MLFIAGFEIGDHWAKFFDNLFILLKIHDGSSTESPLG